MKTKAKGFVFIADLLWIDGTKNVTMSDLVFIHFYI